MSVTYQVQTFAAARELLGSPVSITLPRGAKARDLRQQLLVDFPALATLKDFAIARNEAYALPGEILEAGDELVIIPPVSGG
ncbi:MoaD/ThiS family protein [Neolewinella antarctica]|uniref:Molybdopterin synthase sulfur carrier subunit n=1 Tax=Neolewinella antarctica TaxID=442734 RepID=A0ABX0X6X8_9BACT|nr:MoaD/ThiS family protein [Neolewinella antarctica]NJC24968.1 molybdopterin converting factor small subunit [Neolewinella antarctica]